MGTMGRMSVIMDLAAKKFERDVMGTQKKIAKFAQKARKSINSISFRKIALGAAAFGYALIRLTKHFLAASSQIEGYQIALSKTLGSMKEGNKLFNYMSKFAQTVTHEFKDLMGSAVTLSGIMKGGAAEVIKWMPLLSDLGAYTKLLGIEMWETTSQIIRFFSTGAAAADLFREKGVLALLGFKAGVHYTVKETKDILMKAWEDPKSKFRGLAKDLASTWVGLMSMLKDAWFQARLEVMKGGLFEFLKKQVDMVTAAIKRMSAEGKFITLGKKLAEEVVHLKYTMEALLDVLLFSRKVFNLLTWPAAKMGEMAAMGQINVAQSKALQKLTGGGLIEEAIRWRIKALERLEIVNAGIARALAFREPAAPARKFVGLEEIGGKFHRRMALAWQQAYEESRKSLRERKLTRFGMPEDARKNHEAVLKMIDETQARWVSFADQVKWSWSYTIDEMVRGTIRFGDVAKRIFQDVLSSYLSLVSQWAAGKMFAQTEPFFRQLPGLGSAGAGAGTGEVTKGYGPALSAAGGGITIGNLTITGPDADTITEIVRNNVKRKGVLRG